MVVVGTFFYAQTVRAPELEVCLPTEEEHPFRDSICLGAELFMTFEMSSTGSELELLVEDLTVYRLLMGDSVLSVALVMPVSARIHQVLPNNQATSLAVNVDTLHCAFSYNGRVFP